MRIALKVVAVLAAACSSVMAQKTPPPGPYIGHKVVRVNVGSREQLDQALEIATTSWNCEVGHGPLDLQVTDEQLAALRKLGLAPVVIVPDVQAAFDRERAEIEAARAAADATWFSTFRTLSEINARLDHYATNYPNLATVSVAGQSIEGRDIKVISITGPDLPGNPQSTRPAVIFNACQHAREWAVPMTAMWIADRLVEGYGTDPRLTDYVNRLEFLIVPVVNPDGYELSWTPNYRMWRKNTRVINGVRMGVDNNRNWGYQWGGEGASTFPSDETYRGAAPWSEPENQAMRDLVTANPRLRAHIDFHSAAELVLTPWGYTAQSHPMAGVYAFVGTAMSDAIYAVHQMRYAAGPGYSTIYPFSGGALDWTAGEAGLLGTSIEVRGHSSTGGYYSFQMPVGEIVPNAEESFEGAMRLCDVVSIPLMGTSEPAPPTVLDPDGNPTEVSVAVWNPDLLAGPPVLWTRLDGAGWVPSTTSQVSSNVFHGYLPGVVYCQAAEYYFEAATPSGETLRVPAAGPNVPFRAMPAWSRLAFADDMEQDAGWIVGAPGDSATSGIWSRCDPEMTTAQPGDDHTESGTLAWVTDCRAGANANTYDVDGRTSLITPPISTRPYSFQVASARLSFWYTLVVTSSDPLTVQVRGSPSAAWTTLWATTSSYAAPPVWRARELTVAAASLTDRTQFRFFIADNGNDSTVEAVIDDVELEIIGCERDIDYNGDGAINGYDLECLAQAIAGDPACSRLNPDFNGDGNVNIYDLRYLELAIAGG